MFFLTLAVLAPVLFGGQTGGRKWTAIISKLVAIFLLFTPLFTTSFFLGVILDNPYDRAVFPTFGYHPLNLSWDLFAVVLAPVLIGFGVVIAFHSRIQEIKFVDLKWIFVWFVLFAVPTGMYWFVLFAVVAMGGPNVPRVILWMVMAPIVVATWVIFAKKQG